QKEAFTDFLKDITFVEGQAAVPAHPPIAAGSEDTASGIPSKPSWEVPAHWQEQPGKKMLIAVFAATSDSGKAEVTVSAFPGDVGGLAANVNRWRRLLGLGPAAEGEIAKLASPFEINGESGTLVDMANQSNDNRIAVILWPHAGMTWFFKMTGPDAVVAK